MVHVVYLGAVSNGGSWWRMHKSLPARSRRNRPAWSSVGDKRLRKSAKGERCKKKKPQERALKIHTAAEQIDLEQHMLTPMRAKLCCNSLLQGVFFFHHLSTFRKKCFTKAMISLVFSFSLFNFWQMLTIFSKLLVSWFRENMHYAAFKNCRLSHWF